MKKILIYSRPLMTIKDYNDARKVAGYLAGFDVIITKPRDPVAAADDFKADKRIMQYVLGLNSKVTFSLIIDVETITAAAFADMVNAYGTVVRSSTLTNLSGATVTRAKQIEALERLRIRNLSAIFLAENLEDVVLSIASTPFNPNGNALPIIPEDLVVMLVNTATSTAAASKLIHDGLLAAARRFNNNRQFGILYQYVDDAAYLKGLQSRQTMIDLAAFWRAEYVGFYVGDYYNANGAKEIRLDVRESNLETAYNVRYSRVTDTSVTREDGPTLNFQNIDDITSGVTAS